MITPEDIQQLMDMKAQTVCAKTFLQERPNASDVKLSEFIVVSLPFSFSNKSLAEDDDWWLNLTVVYEIFVADRKTAGNPKEFDNPKMKELRQKLFDLFPIVDKDLGIKIVRPRTVIPASSDGNGFHFTRIQAKLTTMV